MTLKNEPSMTHYFVEAAKAGTYLILLGLGLVVGVAFLTAVALRSMDFFMRFGQ